MTDSPQKSYWQRTWPIPDYRAHARYLESWFDPLEVFSGKRVLDLGSGDNGYGLLIAEKYSPKEVIALDLYSETLLPLTTLSGGRFPIPIAADWEHLPFRDACFDVIWGSTVLVLAADPLRTFREIARVLISGGLYLGFESSPFNVLHLARHIFNRRSSTQKLLSEKSIDSMRALGFSLEIRHFNGRLGKRTPRIAATNMGILATRISGS